MMQFRNRTDYGHPAISFLVAFVKGRIDRVRNGELDRGASAVEWVIISAVVAGIVLGVALIINSALKQGAHKVGDCVAGATPGKTC